MCGITGYLKFNSSAPAPHLEQMLATLTHRGPDAGGEWTDGRCTLGFRRLAIIDLSSAANQPMQNEDGTVRIVFNGEIYNFLDLRQQLESKGHRFRSHSDTETIIHGYEEWGNGVVSRLRGMFAFAIWDQKRSRLVLARDRVGKKPLFYYSDSSRLIFASELQAILAEPTVARVADREAIDAYLSWGYVPPPRTAIQNVQKLPPASILTVDCRNVPHTLTNETYWDLQFSPKLDLSEDEAAEALREKLTEATRLRLVSDVPLGAFLSGGVDSSIVVGLMAQLASGPVKTFSIGFVEQGFNELEHARRVADRWSTEHHEEIVTADALSVLPILVRNYGEPFADSSAIPTYYVSKMTRNYVTVALSGDGGDESFGGYQRYKASLIADRIARVPGSRVAAGVLRAVLPDSPNPKNVLRRSRRFLQFALEAPSVRYGHWVGYFDPADKATLYSPSFGASINPGSRAEDWMTELFGQACDLDAAEAAMSVDIHSYLPSDILTKVDIASMANSLETRSPFLDQDVMEFAATLPRSYKLHGSNQKSILKKAFPELLPPENIRRPKMGFGVPVGNWFRGPLRELLSDTLLGAETAKRNYFNQAKVEELVENHLQMRTDNTAKLWSLLMLELWFREFNVG